MAVAWIAVHNTAPEAVNDEYYVLAGSAVRGNILANDTDADGDSLRVVKINDQPPRQLMRLPSGAQLVMNPNGDFVYYAVERQMLHTLGTTRSRTPLVMVLPRRRKRSLSGLRKCSELNG
jgi:hypothetical protein